MTKEKILSFCFSKANVDDRDQKVESNDKKDVFGKLFGDRGYMSKISRILVERWVELIYKVERIKKDEHIRY